MSAGSADLVLVGGLNHLGFGREELKREISAIIGDSSNLVRELLHRHCLLFSTTPSI